MKKYHFLVKRMIVYYFNIRRKLQLESGTGDQDKQKSFLDETHTFGENFKRKK
jgi:hypothetical protein